MFGKKEVIIALLILMMALTGCSTCLKLPKMYMQQTEEGTSIKFTDWIAISSCNATPPDDLLNTNKTEYKTPLEQLRENFTHEQMIRKIDNTTTLIDLNPRIPGALTGEIPLNLTDSNQS